MAESSGETWISRYIGLYSAESTITHAKNSLRLFLGSSLGRRLTADALDAAGERYLLRNGIIRPILRLSSNQFECTLRRVSMQ